MSILIPIAYAAGWFFLAVGAWAIVEGVRRALTRGW